MNHQGAKLSSFSAVVVLLSACGAGSVDGPQAGIEGSGVDGTGRRITSSGVVTALGSIVVDGVHYDLDGTTITINGSSASDDALAPGHVAIVQGELSADGQRGVATRVSVEVALAGTVSAVDRAVGRLSILGQTVAVRSSTIIEGRIEDDSLGGLGLGSDVEVSGFADSSGVLHATRIEPRRTTTPLLITGSLSNLDTSTRTFSIHGQVVSYTTATLVGLEAIAEGAPVRVAARFVQQGALVADEVVVRDTSLPGALGDAATLQGWVTRFESETDFDVDGRRVLTTVDTRTGGPIEGAGVALDAFVSVGGDLTANGAVRASRISAVAPGRLAGSVTVDNGLYAISGVMTPAGRYRLNIQEQSGGQQVLDSGLGQLIGSFDVTGRDAVGTGVLIGEGCASAPSRFCGAETAVRIELTKTGSSRDEGSDGVIRVTTGGGEEIWPAHFGYWGGRAGFDHVSFLPGLYEIHQAEFSHGGTVIMSVDAGGRLFFQSAETGCVGNGAFAAHTLNLYDLKLRIENCTDSFAYLNADFEGLATVESFTPWDYDLSVLTLWASTVAGTAPPAAISLWASAIDR